MSHRLGGIVRRFALDKSGLALIEFAMIFPILLTLCLTGAELTNYIVTKTQVSQLALMLADNAARMGGGSPLAAKTVSERDISDLFVGADLQSGNLKLSQNARVILSDIEEDSSNVGKYQIRWQRCYGGQATHASTYGTAPATNLAGVGPANRQITAQANSATMFVEVYYVYTPLVSSSLVPSTAMTEIASMAVRDRRNLSLPSQASGVIPSNC